MFEAWGRKIFEWRGRTLVISGALLALSLLVVARGGVLQTGTIAGIEADRAAKLVDAELPSEHTSGFTIIFHSDTLTTDDERFQNAVADAVRPLRNDPRVLRVRTPWDEETGYFLGQTMQSVEGHDALATVILQKQALESTRYFPDIRRKLRSDVLDVKVTGFASFRSELDETLERDLIRADFVSGPLAFIVLLLVFGSIVAALLPVGVGGLAVVGGIAAVFALSHLTPIAQYAINIVSLVGLGVSIDYSLFIVSRFREELGAGKSIPLALEITMATAGRAVAFSGIAVATGLMGLLFFEGSYLASLGLGGTLVILLLVFYSLTFLPALLAVLGNRIHSGALPIRIAFSHGFWPKIAHAVMRRPLVILLPTLAILIAAGLPFLHLRIAIPDSSVLPKHSETRRAAQQLEEQFPERAYTRIAVVVQFPTRPFDKKERIEALWDASKKISTLPGVDHVESVVDADPMLDRTAIAEALTGPRENLSEGVLVAMGETVGRTIVILSVLTEAPAGSEEARTLVRRIRELRSVGDGTLLVTGQTALDLDSQDFLREHAPKAIAFVVLATVVVLFLLLRSVVLPLKAVLMNLLSLTGSFGALVWVFQDGHFAELLHFEPGPIEPSVPILLFCVTFGLSMDYEVLLLTRMQEEYRRTRDNARAVAEGLTRSGRLITSAAAIMVAVFAAYVTAEIVLLKMVGIGMAIAVLLDATIVRLVVVPATMRLFGDLNWWAPAWFSGRRDKKTKIKSD